MFPRESSLFHPSHKELTVFRQLGAGIQRTPLCFKERGYNIGFKLILPGDSLKFLFGELQKICATINARRIESFLDILRQVHHGQKRLIKAGIAHCILYRPNQYMLLPGPVRIMDVAFMQFRFGMTFPKNTDLLHLPGVEIHSTSS